MYLTTRQVHTLHSLIKNLPLIDEPSSGDKALVSGIAKLFRAEVVSLFANPIQRDIQHRWSIGIDERLVANYLARWRSLSPLRPALNQRDVGLSSAIMPVRRLTTTQFYEGFLRDVGVLYGLNIRLLQWYGVPSEIRIWRSAERGDFSNDDQELAWLLRPMLTPLTKAAPLSAATMKPMPLMKFGAGRQVLTAMERAIAAYLLSGASDKEIARAFGIEQSTVRTHVGHIFRKFDVRSRTHFMASIHGMRNH
jgi:DNA-binding CsgD family transcriptional regulator